MPRPRGASLQHTVAWLHLFSDAVRKQDTRSGSTMACRAPNSPSPTPWRSIGLLWLAFALINASQIVVGMRAVGMQHAWARLFFVVLASWLVWALATPLILR